MDVNSSSEAGAWLKPVGEIFLGLNMSAVIRRVVGAVEIVPGLMALQLQVLTWQEFVNHYADETARSSLKAAWMAMAEHRVAPAYWPPYLPFKRGVIARLRPVENDPIISFVVHLSTAGEYDLLNTLIGNHLLNVMAHTIRVGQHLFRGSDGPLTDLQIKSLGDIISSAEHTTQLLEDLRAAVLLPAMTAPQPHTLSSLFAFSARDFSHHRIRTHQLAIRSDLSTDAAYCHDSIRAVIRHTLDVLLAAIVPQTAIVLSSAAHEDTLQVQIDYTSLESALQVTGRIEPLALSDPDRLDSMSTIQRLVTAAHACLRPVNGRAWAEPHQDSARVVLVLPRWKGALPQ
jgi:hypothetical protein